jgi:hypothetical protein
MKLLTAATGAEPAPGRRMASPVSAEPSCAAAASLLLKKSPEGSIIARFWLPFGNRLELVAAGSP